MDGSMGHEQAMRPISDSLNYFREGLDSAHRIIVTGQENALTSLIIDTSAVARARPIVDRPALADKLSRLFYLMLLQMYRQTLSRYVEKFTEFANNPLTDHPEWKGGFHYPLFEIFVRDAKIGGPKQIKPIRQYPKSHYGFLAEPGTYETTITCPTLFDSYLQRQIRALVFNHWPVVRVRESIKRIPVHFAINARNIGELGTMERPHVREIEQSEIRDIPLHFDVPILDDIKDISGKRKTQTIKVPSLAFINTNFFRMLDSSHNDKKTNADFLIARAKEIQANSQHISKMSDEAITGDSLISALLEMELNTKREGNFEHEIHPLSLFAADRIDYSLGRLGHYTKTPASDFQNFVIFTNYHMYVEEFVEYCLMHVIVSAFLTKEGAATDVARSISPGNPGLITNMLNKLFTAEVEMSLPFGQGKRLTASWLIKDYNIWGELERQLPNLADPVFETVIACVKRILKGRPLSQAPGDIEKVISVIAKDAVPKFVGKALEIGAAGPKMPQMPAYHLCAKDSSGLTLVNIGVGSSNAKTITDHIAVLRPYAWLMIGHCAGVRATQHLGHFVIGNGYLRADGILDRQIKREISIPAIDEINEALEKAAEDAWSSEMKKEEDKEGISPIRVGPVATVLDRNWELSYPDPELQMEAAKVIAVDMESATIAANGFRFSVPYGTFLCVSDKPLHGELKMEGMAEAFYRSAVKDHFRIGVRAVESLREAYGEGGIASKTLRERQQSPFQ